jgi:hypothetical protein
VLAGEDVRPNQAGPRAAVDAHAREIRVDTVERHEEDERAPT